MAEGRGGWSRPMFIVSISACEVHVHFHWPQELAIAFQTFLPDNRKEVCSLPEKLKNMHRVEMLRQHNERCPECKDNVKRLLTSLFGDVAVNKALGLPCRLDDLKDVKEYERLALIFETLQRHRLRCRKMSSRVKCTRTVAHSTTWEREREAARGLWAHKLWTPCSCWARPGFGSQKPRRKKTRRQQNVSYHSATRPASFAMQSLAYLLRTRLRPCHRTRQYALSIKKKPDTTKTVC